MKRQAAKIDQDTVTWETDRAKHIAEETVAKALRFLADPDKKKRLAEGLCATCCYLLSVRIGGAAMTCKPCGICGEEMTFGSTATDDLCKPCALKHELCRQCGGDVRLRVRRVFP